MTRVAQLQLSLRVRDFEQDRRGSFLFSVTYSLGPRGLGVDLKMKVSKKSISLAVKTGAKAGTGLTQMGGAGRQ